MTTHRFLVSAHTEGDTIGIRTPEELLEMLRVSLDYTMHRAIDKVEVVTDDMLWTNSIPEAELTYLQEHPVKDMLDLLRAHIPQDGPVLEMDHIFHDALLMIQALNAVKVGTNN